jgi:hypothetical protein
MQLKILEWKSAIADGKENFVNIYKFDMGWFNIDWNNAITAGFGPTKIKLVVPSLITKSGDPERIFKDLHNYQYINLGFSNVRVNTKPEDDNHFVWSGLVNSDKTKPIEMGINYCLNLEFPPIYIKPMYFTVKTPSGRPGNPATILIDRTGNLVPQLTFPSMSVVLLEMLDGSWNKWGWHLDYPAIGLYFQEGICNLSHWEIEKFQGMLKRNKFYPPNANQY